MRKKELLFQYREGGKNWDTWGERENGVEICGKTPRKLGGRRGTRDSSFKAGKPEECIKERASYFCDLQKSVGGGKAKNVSSLLERLQRDEKRWYPYGIFWREHRRSRGGG